MMMGHPIIMLPFIYDMGAQVLQMAERRDVNTPMIIMQAVNMQLRKFLEKRTGLTSESSLYAAVVDLLSSLTFPMPGQQPGPLQQQQQQQQGVMQGNINVPTGQFLSPGLPPQMQQIPPQMQANQMQGQVPQQMVGVNPMNQMG